MPTPPNLRSHPCPGCGRSDVPNTELACRACWFRLPANIRAVVDRTYRFRQTNPGAWRRAVAFAIKWYRNNPEVPGGTPDQGV